METEDPHILEIQSDSGYLDMHEAQNEGEFILTKKFFVQYSHNKTIPFELNRE